jgi:hypothetical protein
MPAAAQDFDRYFWEQPVVNDIATAEVSVEQQLLQSEIQQILDRGALAPLRMNYSDLDFEGYWIYRVRGQVIGTLAKAYPYLTDAQQGQVSDYVQAVLASGDEAPWQSALKAAGEGEERRLHGYALTTGRYPHNPAAGSTPTLQVLYGLWLYGERSGDWPTVQRYWPQIKDYYAVHKREPVLYGQISGFIGMLRLAQQFGDTDTVALVEADARAQFSAALDPAVMAERQASTSFAYFTADRKVEYFPGQPWMYLDASPEVLRFIAETASLREEAVERLGAFEALYPEWWLHQAPYFTRWTGDESVGLTPEVFGLLMPYHDWLAATDTMQLKTFMRSAPVGIGDLYWIESLVSVIEANGRRCWVDVRSADQAGLCDPA